MNPSKFIPIARAIAAMSKDPSRKVGAVILDDDGTILSTGYNGFPRGVRDHPERYAEKPVKYQLISHAEQNAVAQAARTGQRLLGSTIIVTELHPCSGCAKSIIQAGIKRVLAPRPTSCHSDLWAEEAKWAALMFHEAGVAVEYYEP